MDSIQLNNFPVEWAGKDVSYLKKEVYDEQFKQRVLDAGLVSAHNAKGEAGPGRDLRVEYHGFDTGSDCFERLAKLLGIMDNIKAGVPRTAYHGVVEFKWKSGTIFLAPPVNEIDWD